MHPTQRLTDVERAMLRTPAHSLGDALGDILHTHYGVAEAEVFLADYRTASLEPVLNPGSGGQPISSSPAGAAYAQQKPVVDGEFRHLPISVRGDRLGVLRLRWPGPPPEDLSELAELAERAGQALIAAEVVTDRFRRARRTERLTLAAEMQWDLLPGRCLDQAEFSLAGQLEPAYAVRGDNFDWSADEEHLTVAVTNGMGESVDAALLTSLAIHALRNARRAGVDLADQAALADQAIWAQYGGKQHVATLLLQVELATGRLAVIDAGSPQIWRLRGDEVLDVRLEPQLPLGMFDSTHYLEQRFELRPGDRLVIISDGVYEARAEGLSYGEELLSRLLAATRGLSAAEAVRALMADLSRFSGHIDLDDDAVAVCLDWRGRTA
ncbi:serine/threonine-protein phosphatase [Allokutzneria sp. A3M-2-11 16]|uniref:PP2C family protein-serine/threonine phosphatase n=1 Tax=Allokutzneria sp. A3M-2-11 16 TaxID=2962043 RepID=UPI0020B6D9F8|nr:PP2C family protein-serine/threonine phosphatase [Allokutzneria sp. A3M-2-11 16]MCP3801090.1 serine/threonine-protein phosphatase [Allokutzneria sp. A3M-2-11 16]